MVRAFGSYPTDRWFDSTRRYQKRNPFCLPRQERFFLAFGAKYSFAGQQTVAADSASLSITNPTAFESRPDIKLYGSGAVVIMIQPQGRGMMISNLDEYIEIDSELMNCFKDTVLKNDILSGGRLSGAEAGNDHHRLCRKCAADRGHSKVVLSVRSFPIVSGRKIQKSMV